MNKEKAEEEKNCGINHSNFIFITVKNYNFDTYPNIYEPGRSKAKN